MTCNMVNSSSGPHIGLIVTGEEALADFAVFCKTLEVWHPDATLYVFTDSETETGLISTVFKGTVHSMTTMDSYRGLKRKEMEKLPGKLYDTLFKDYTYEKANVLDWMFESISDLNGGVWFLDADICHCAPLPEIPLASGTTLALSPHYIQTRDEALYGKYNAGFLWLNDPSLVQAWRSLGVKSRFFEQAALEDLAVRSGVKLYEFPIQVNFGWWRMFQGRASVADVQAGFTISKLDKSIGIRYKGKPIQSFHTHWFQKTSVTGAFNTWIVDFLRPFSTYEPIEHFLKAIC